MNYWDHLEPQILEHISDLHFQGYRDQDIAEVLENRHYWVAHEIFRNEVFNYEKARFTLHQLCNIMDMLIGSDTAFLDALNVRIRSLLNVEYEQEVEAQEGQRELVWSLNRAIDRRESA